MSVPLKQEKKSETALVVFTLLVPAAAGMALFALFAAVFGVAPSAAANTEFGMSGGLLAASVSIAFATIGMLGSVTHLAKPLRAPTSLRNLRSSWLSREIAAVSAFWGCLALWLLGELLRLDWLSVAGCALAVISGIVLLTVIARAYKVSTRPAWCGHECFIELLACLVGTGGVAVALCFAAATGGSISRTLWIAVVAASCAGLALDVSSHKLRRNRLEALRAESDERIPLTLARYDELHGKVRAAWVFEAAALVFFIAGLWLVALVAQLIAHGIHRVVFYDLPVQVRYVAHLRK